MATESVTSIANMQNIDTGGGVFAQRVSIVSGTVQTATYNIVESLSGNTSTTHTLSQASKGASIANDGLFDFTFTINGITITVLAEESVNGNFADFTEIIITNAGGSDYRIAVLA